MRSRTGCLTCRTRKLKCDEIRPICGQCKKASKECRPSQGITFRHQQNASMNGAREESSTTDTLDSFYSYRNTFTSDHVWLEIPREVQFVHIVDPYAETETPERAEDRSLSSPRETTSSPNVIHSRWTAPFTGPSPSRPGHVGLEALSTAAANSFSQAASDTLSQSAYTPPAGRTASSHSHSSLEIYPSVSRNAASPIERQARSGIMTPLDPSLDNPAHPMSIPSQMNQLSRRKREMLAPEERDHEIAFLLRHHVEVTGYAMDLFDCGRYFSYHVPVKALSNNLLKYAACAYAAKQIGRVGGMKPIVGGGCTQQARMELWPGIGKVDWSSYEMKYYDKALSLLRQALEEQQLWAAPGVPTSNARSQDTGSENHRASDELLAATAILCEYEAMDANGVTWAQHLKGTKSLLDVAEVGMQPNPEAPGSSSQPKFAGARKAIFWNFARQDFAAAYLEVITKSEARLDVNNHTMWKAAGVDLDESGCIVAHGAQGTRVGNDTHSQEDMIANSLILLLSKLNNFIAAGETIFPTAMALRTTRPDERSRMVDRLGVSQQALLERWDEIRREIDTWYSNLPETFTPCARISHPVFSEVWYSIPMCASAMQSYHMARILLLINKPHESTGHRTTIGNRLKSYQSITEEISHHSREICGIALSRPEGSVRIFSIQPLFVAGNCLTDERERRIILDLLSHIEKDTGWTTKYRVQQLLEEWEWDEVPQGS